MKISEICDINRSSISRGDDLDEILYLDTSSITENSIEGYQKLTLSEAPSRAQRKVQDKTIIYSSVRPNLKHYGIVTNPEPNLIVSSGFITIDIKNDFQDRINPYYLYIVLTQPYVTKHLQSIAENSVSAYPSINPDDLAMLEFDFPNREIQDRIASIIENCDKEIALTNGLNRNLEQIARQLYDYWFVQFDFPNTEGKPYKSSGGEMVYSELFKREIPSDWVCKSLGEYANVRKGTTITKAQTVEGNIKVVAAATDYSFLHNSANRTAYCITISSSGANAGFINFWREPIYASDCSTVQGQSVIETLFCYYSLLHYQDILFNQQIGAAQPHVYPEHISKIPIVIPPVEILDKVKIFFLLTNERQASLSKELDHLKTLRDELLPMLLNGQVTVRQENVYDFKPVDLPLAAEPGEVNCDLSQ